MSLCDSSVHALARALNKGETTSFDATQACLERINRTATQESKITSIDDLGSDDWT